MGSRTICAECAHRALIDTSADTPPDAVRVVAQGGTPSCLAPEMLRDPVTGLGRLPRPCEAINVVAACPWFDVRKDVAAPNREGDLRVRGKVEWIEAAKAVGGVIPGLSNAELEALRAREARKTLPRPPFPPPPPNESVSAAIVIANERAEVKK